MITRFIIALLILSGNFTATAQSFTTTAYNTGKDSFCDSLQVILNNSASGFINYRYNERQNNQTTVYNTTLSSLGFQRKFVQIGLVSPYQKSWTIPLPYYIVNSNFSDQRKADLFFTKIRSRLFNCISGAEQDTVPFAGYKRYARYQLKKADKDSFVTAELILLSSPHVQSVVLKIFNNRASIKKGVMLSYTSKEESLTADLPRLFRQLK